MAEIAKNRIIPISAFAARRRLTKPLRSLELRFDSMIGLRAPTARADEHMIGGGWEAR